MQIPEYDPAVAANILAGLAFLVSLFSYRLSRATQRAAAEASEPDVHATVAAVKDRPGWLFLQLKVTNHLPNELEASDVCFLWPPLAKGLTQSQASMTGPSGEQILLPEMPRHLARNKVQLNRMLAPSGTRPGSAPHHLRDTEWIGIYVQPRPDWLSFGLRFDVAFSLRKTDMRRFRRIVIPQSISVPAKQRS